MMVDCRVRLLEDRKHQLMHLRSSYAQEDQKVITQFEIEFGIEIMQRLMFVVIFHVCKFWGAFSFWIKQ
jgi:hypothetical protein